MKDYEFMNEWQKQFEKTGVFCPKTDVKMTFTGGENRVNTNISIDRINNKIIYEKGNVQFVTNIYNTIKGFYEEKEIDEFCYKRVEIIERLKNG